MEPHSTSTPVTVPIVAACREVSTTVSVRRASRERRRRQAKGWRSTSVSRRPGFARASCSVSRASCSVSRSSTSAGGKGACLNGAAAAAAAMHTALASIDGRENLQREEGSGRLKILSGNRHRSSVPLPVLPFLTQTSRHCSRASQISSLHSPSASSAARNPACCELGAAAGRGGGAHACCPALRGAPPSPCEHCEKNLQREG